MIDLRLTPAQMRAYLRALRFGRDIRLRVDILDRNEKPKSSLTSPQSQVVDGLVTVDGTAEIRRSLTLTIVDLQRRLTLDPASPSPAALFADQFIRVVREDYVEALGDYVECPVFWGPINRFERAGEVVTIEAQGKEALAMEPHVIWRTMNRKKGMRTVRALRDVMMAIGERRFDLPELNHKMPTALAVGRHDEAWKVARKLARSMNRQVFYDGRGRLRVRGHPAQPGFTFYGVQLPNRPEPTIIGDPKVSYTFEFRNLIEVLGPEPKKGKPRIRKLAKAPASHPLSPQSLARNGVNRYLVETIENDKVENGKEALALARRVLKDRLRIGVEAEFESFPMPFLEEGDIIAVVTRDGSFEFRLQKFTIPLTTKLAQSIGHTKRVQIGRRRRRR